MAKEITRTVTTYKHTFGKIKKGDDGTLIIDDLYEVVMTTKMGNKLAVKYIKDNELPEGVSLLSVEENFEKYAMSVDDFIKNAVKVEG